jgi:hypothetical protein
MKPMRSSRVNRPANSAGSNLWSESMSSKSSRFRRCYVAVFLHERQLDNARALMEAHNAQTREVKFNDRFHAFCRYWVLAPK